MSAQEQKAVVRRVYEDVINKGHLAAIDELFAANYVLHGGPPGLPPGPEGAKQWFGIFRNAFPDIYLTVEELIAEGDKVVSRFTARGTHQGELFGIPPTNKQATWTGLVLTRFENGKAVEDWVSQDQLGMLQQLGVIPVPGQGGS